MNGAKRDREAVSVGWQLGAFRRGFRGWRRTRPFWAGVWVAAGGAVLAFPLLLAPLGVMLTGGPAVTSGIGIGIVLMAGGLVFWFRPEQKLFVSIVCATASLISFTSSNFGGMGIGMLLGIIGSSMAFGWRRRAVPHGDATGEDKDDKDGHSEEAEAEAEGESGAGRERDGEPAPPAGTASMREDPAPVDGTWDQHVAGRQQRGGLRWLRSFLFGGLALSWLVVLGLVPAATARADSCIPLPLSLSDCPESTQQPTTSPTPVVPLPSPVVPPPTRLPSPEPGTGGFPGRLTPKPTATDGLPYRQVPASGDGGGSKTVPRGAPAITADRLVAKDMVLKGSSWIQTSNGRVKVLVMHVREADLTNYRLTTAQSNPGLGMHFDLVVDDVDMYMEDMSGSLTVGGVSVPVTLSTKLIPASLPIGVPVPRLELQDVSAKQFLIVSPRLDFTGLGIHSH